MIQPDLSKIGIMYESGLKKENRIILHIDLDCFFAAVEARDNPKYKGKPLIVGADPKGGNGRGVVSTCSYEARKFGIHSAMPISQAYELCPDGIFIHPHFKKYSETSDKVFTILQGYSPIFQAASIDEAYIELTNICKDFSEAEKIAESIRKKVKEELHITCSVGCGPTKSIAKIASDHNKPEGITVVEPDSIELFLKNMKITRIPGIGKKSKLYYYQKGIRKIGDFYKLGKEKIEKLFGRSGEWIWNVISGIDNRAVIEIHDRKSISKETTFSRDIGDFKTVIAKIKDLNEHIHDKIMGKGIRYRTISLKIRFKGYTTYTRAKTLNSPMIDRNKAFSIIMELIDEFLEEKRKIRLIGIRFSNFDKDNKTRQMTLFDFTEHN